MSNEYQKRELLERKKVLEELLPATKEFLATSSNNYQQQRLKESIEKAEKELKLINVALRAI
ncbi:hypothetical protein [Pseudoclavibacter helvolus]|uniref:hypothetical protein n=1 Tax=Pseudoclavibacter helvolus TaxID=255205 RepID=UPI003C7735E5